MPNQTQNSTQAGSSSDEAISRWFEDICLPAQSRTEERLKIARETQSTELGPISNDDQLSLHMARGFHRTAKMLSDAILRDTVQLSREDLEAKYSLANDPCKRILSERTIDSIPYAWTMAVRKTSEQYCNDDLSTAIKGTDQLAQVVTGWFVKAEDSFDDYAKRFDHFFEIMSVEMLKTILTQQLNERESTNTDNKSDMSQTVSSATLRPGDQETPRWARQSHIAVVQNTFAVSSFFKNLQEKGLWKTLTSDHMWRQGDGNQEAPFEFNPELDAKVEKILQGDQNA